MIQSQENRFMRQTLQTVRPIKVHSYGTPLRLVDITPPTRYVQWEPRKRLWVKRVTESQLTNNPQWDTLTVGERVSHGEERRHNNKNDYEVFMMQEHHTFITPPSLMETLSGLESHARPGSIESPGRPTES